MYELLTTGGGRMFVARMLTRGMVQPGCIPSGAIMAGLGEDANEWFGVCVVVGGKALVGARQPLGLLVCPSSRCFCVTRVDAADGDDDSV